MTVDAVYFDGKTARNRPVTLSLVAGALEFSGEGVAPLRWSLAGLHAIDPPADGQPFRLTHDDVIGARLVLQDQDFVNALLAALPRLKGHYGVRHFKQVAGWTIGGLVGLGVAGWFVFTFLPNQIAGLLPERWRDASGIQLERSLVGNLTACAHPAGVSALGAMIGNIAQGDDKMPPIKVTVYDMPMVNAFAVTGGRIIMTRGILNAASSPEEVAGVLAHEIGHVVHLHPEEQMVRVAGLQVLSSVLTGGTSGEIISTAAGLATLLRYSRNAEGEADRYARETLTAAAIDPMGFRSFFEKVQMMEGGKKAEADDFSILARIGSMLNSHPDTAERIKLIEPLPAGVIAKPSLSPQQWRDLQNICNA
jgi:beta-barrel assembly-enhancing protease